LSAVLGSLRRLILGETWTVPLGVGAALALATLLRVVVSDGTWDWVGGFCLALLVVAALACSLRTPS